MTAGARQDLIVRALLQPASTASFSGLDWDLLIRQARRANLLGRLAYVLGRAGLMDEVPAAPRQHLLSATIMAERQAASVRWEVDCLRRELTDTGVTPVLLKGAAYVVLGLPVAGGRTFSDIDLLVPKDRLPDVEGELMFHGWEGSHHDAYDQRYYRQWMHEIPPLRHNRRGTALDVHHTILPETARVKVNTPALFRGFVPVLHAPGISVLQPWDMFLHSATHLFHEGDFDNGLRDLFDLDMLLRDFGTRAGFWQGLVPRARELGLTRPLYYALRMCTLMLHTPVPDDVLSEARIGRPAAWLAGFMDACYLRALRPMHASTTSLGSGPARFALYIRSHWIRMPMGLLLVHLLRKALVREKPPEASPDAAQGDDKTQA